MGQALRVGKTGVMNSAIVKGASEMRRARSWCVNTVTEQALTPPLALTEKAGLI